MSQVAYPALEAIVDAYHRRVNGRFVFRRNGAERSVILVFRKLFFANSTEKKDRIELLLATRKLLRKEEILRIAAKAKETGIDFMTAVQREGVLKDVAMFDVMSDRARDIVIDLMTWSDCEVEHDPRGFTAEAVLPLNSDLLPVLVEGLQSRFSADDSMRLLGAEDQVLRPLERPYVLQELARSPHGALLLRIFEQVNGKRTVADVLAATGADTMTALKGLAVLRLLGAIELPSNVSGAALGIAQPAPAFADTVYEEGIVTAPVELSSEERSALANIFEGAANLLEDDTDASEELEITVDDDENDGEIGESELLASQAGFAVEAGGDDEADEPIEGLEDPPAQAAPEAELPLELGEDSQTFSTPQVQSDFNALLDIDPEEGAKLFSAALELFQRGRVGSALQVYQQAIDKDPSNAEYYSAIGLAYLEDSAETPADEHAAMAAFLEAVKLSPEAPKNHYYLGKIYLARGEKEAALASFEQALRFDPGYAPAKQAIEGMREPAGESKEQSMGFLKKLFGR